ncbi:MAG: hypothetical protein K2K17_07860 [Lachnospiraceae bacterium]|nr:hypothetical protein [Lachnospiraceae bacterium]
MGSFKKTLKQEFPRTPESFRQCVNNAVSEQRISRRKRFRFVRTAIPVAACLILVSGTVMAAEFPAFTKWLAELGVNSQEAGEMIIHVDDGSDVTGPDIVGPDAVGSDAIGQEDPFKVTDVYYDGATLLFLAESCGLQELAFGDHVFINGTDNRLEYVVEIEEGSGIWQCEVSIMDEKLAESAPEKLDVTVQVYMESGEKQDFTFSIESDKLGSVSTAADQRFEFSYGVVEVSELKVAPSNVSFTLKWTVYREEDFDILRGALFFCEDSSGVRYAPNELRRNASCSLEVRNEDTGWIEFEQSYEIQNFDSASEYMLFIPAEGGYDEEGSYIGTETPREDMSFMIKF